MQEMKVKGSSIIFVFKVNFKKTDEKYLHKENKHVTTSLYEAKQSSFMKNHLPSYWR